MSQSPPLSSLENHSPPSLPPLSSPSSPSYGIDRERETQQATMLKLVARRRSLKGAAGGGILQGRAGFASQCAGEKSRLHGKVALITGGASGLGLATAREFIRQGADVVIADVNSRLGTSAAEELGGNTQFIECDVSVEQQVSDAVDFAVARHGRLDVMHNNAGISTTHHAGVAGLDLSEFDRVMSVNVRGTVAGIKHAARAMASVGSGSILCMASISGIMGGLGPHAYSISKFAIAGVVKSAASELCRAGIRVNCISPFAVPTTFVVDQLALYYGTSGGGRESIKEMVYGLGELKGARCEEADVAKAAVYLASDEAKYVTGHNLVVDGGFTCFKHLNLPMPDQIV